MKQSQRQRFARHLLTCNVALFLALALTHTHVKAEALDDRAQINAVIEKFRAGIIRKDARSISELLLNTRIMFNVISDQQGIDKTRQLDVNFDGLGSPGFLVFAKLIAQNPNRIEETFNDIKVMQDGPFATVTFDYAFLENGKISNKGVEHWQLRKIDGDWKIFSVIWTER